MGSMTEYGVVETSGARTRPRAMALLGRDLGRAGVLVRETTGVVCLGLPTDHRATWGEVCPDGIGTAFGSGGARTGLTGRPAAIVPVTVSATQRFTKPVQGCAASGPPV
jgi:hypothetical protein